MSCAEDVKVDFETTMVVTCKSEGNRQADGLGGGVARPVGCETEAEFDLDARTGILKRPISIVAGLFEGVKSGAAAEGHSPSTIVVERVEASVLRRADIWSKDGSAWVALFALERARALGVSLLSFGRRKSTCSTHG